MPVRRLLLLIPLAALVLAAACASSDTETTAGIIHRLLVAAGSDGTGELESFAGELPPDLPFDPPIYPDADIVVSSVRSSTTAETDPATGETPQPALYFIVLDTADGRDEVRRYYEETVDEDPWQLESSFSTEQLDTIQFTDVQDPDINGAISIAAGGEDGHTSVLVSLQDAGAFVEEPPPYEPGESLGLPKDFPEDVPVYEDAAVTGTAFFREPQNESFLLVFITTDRPEDVIAFYTEAFEAQGWTVTTAQSFGFEDTVDFSDDANAVQGNLSAQTFSRDDDYTEVTIQFRQDPGRLPAGDAEGEDGGETPEDGDGGETPAQTEEDAG